MNAHVMNRNKLLKIEMKSNTQGNGVLNKIAKMALWQPRTLRPLETLLFSGIPMMI